MQITVQDCIIHNDKLSLTDATANKTQVNTEAGYYIFS